MESEEEGRIVRIEEEEEGKRRRDAEKEKGGREAGKRRGNLKVFRRGRRDGGEEGKGEKVGSWDWNGGME